MRRFQIFGLLLTLSITGCSLLGVGDFEKVDGDPDQGPGDAGDDAPPLLDGGDDVDTADTGPVDAGDDAGPVDAGDDAGPVDAGDDAGPADAGDDAGPVDAGDDAPPPVPTDVVAISPWNGKNTGSVRAGEGLAIHPLRPKFRWLAAADADHYEVQLTQTCPVGDFALCTFSGVSSSMVVGTVFVPAEDLSVSMVAPVGARYYWRVRACNARNACSAWSAVRYLNVGRQASDFDGDGYADLVVGAQGEGDYGAVHVYGGSASASAPSVLYFAEGTDAGGNFGATVGAGDINADGYGDLIVGAHGEATGGNVYVFYGSLSGPSMMPSVTFANPGGEFSQFGYAVGAGDIDGDGFSDVLVGARGRRSSSTAIEGVVHVFFGADAVALVPSITINDPSAAMGTGFGNLVANVGDLNGDGYVEIGVSAFLDRNGRAYVFNGGPDGPDPSLGIELSLPEGGQFGSALASAGDTNGDGYGDLVVTAPFEDSRATDAGTAVLYLGGPSAIATHTTELTRAMPARSDHFGSAAIGGDFDSDGFSEVVIGSIRHLDPPRPGRAFLYSGSSTTPMSRGSSLMLSHATDTMVNGFGRALAVSDLNGDGYPDLAVGSYQRADAGRGGVSVYYGGGMGIRRPVSWTIDGPEGGSVLFGRALR